ncbi:MAG TPA: DUF255 domain-containing protein [Candidatus Baltobacteraceae bacterium]|jgi:hypothetical protein
MDAIAWNDWNSEAFERATREKKPILLSISAVWCHWCHVMDRTTYSDLAVIARVNADFVPIRVDNDRRPDINARYNQGGWPTTAFLTPDGSLLTGATYLPAEAMRRTLDEIAEFYRTNGARLEQRDARGILEPANDPETGSDLDGGTVERVLDEIVAGYDESYAGFGTEPKFPMTDALEFLLQSHRLNGDQRLYEIVANTMLAMTRGGMYDRVEGGFFRYSTTRDWSIPHFEKMAEDHAGLLRVLAQLLSLSRNAAFHVALRSAIGYVCGVLRDPETGLFAGSQDADEEYYSLPLDERRARGAPFVDRRSYSNWSAALAGALLVASDALDDDALRAMGESALDALHERVRDDDGLLHHVLERGAAPQVRGLLADQSAYLRALLDAHECGGEARFLRRACEIADAVERTLAAPGGGYYDRNGLEDELGALRVKTRPLGDNALMADSLLRLAALEDEPRHHQTAERTLRLFARTYSRAGSFAAPYARAVQRFFEPASTVTIVASTAGGAELREAARCVPNPLVAVRTIAPDDADELGRRGYAAVVHPVAYVCSGTACGPAVREATQIAAAFETLATSGR